MKALESVPSRIELARLPHHKTAAVIKDPEVKPPPNLLNIDSDDGRAAVLDGGGGPEWIDPSLEH